MRARKPKPITIQEILRSLAYTPLQKKIAVIKWRHNQLPDFYKEQHLKIVRDQIAVAIAEDKKRKADLKDRLNKNSNDSQTA